MSLRNLLGVRICPCLLHARRYPTRSFWPPSCDVLLPVLLFHQSFQACVFFCRRRCPLGGLDPAIAHPTPPRPVVDFPVPSDELGFDFACAATLWTEKVCTKISTRASASIDERCSSRECDRRSGVSCAVCSECDKGAEVGELTQAIGQTPAASTQRFPLYTSGGALRPPASRVCTRELQFAEGSCHLWFSLGDRHYRKRPNTSVIVQGWVPQVR